MTDYTIPSAHVNGPAGQTHPQQSPSHEWDANSHDGTPYIIVDGQRTTLTTTLSPDDLLALQEQLPVAQLITIYLGNLPSLSSSQQIFVGRICYTVRGRCRFQTPDGSLLASPLSALVHAATDLNEHAKLQLATTAIQLAAAWWQDDLDAAVDGVTAALKTAKLRKPSNLANKITRAVRRQQSSERERPRIAEIVRTADIDPDLYQAVGWDYDCNSDCTIRQDGPVRGESVDRLDGLLFIVSKSIDRETRQQMVELGWYRHGALQRFTVPRQQLMRTGRVEELSGVGLPVSSVSSKLFVTYI